jgi:uncharacterized protein
MTQLFTTLPVEDAARSRAFFEALGFTNDPAFSDERSGCFPLGEGATVMLVERERFAELSPRPVGDPRSHALQLLAFTVPTREDVDRIGDAALAAGGEEAHPLEDEGFMVSRAFYDPDGHGWQVMWFAPAEGAEG